MTQVGLRRENKDNTIGTSENEQNDDPFATLLEGKCDGFFGGFHNENVAGFFGVAEGKNSSRK